MLLKYFYDEALAHASYLVGCQQAKAAIVIDPARDIDQYLEWAGRNGLSLTAVAETHIHADYVSGARELADRLGATLYLSDEGPAEWKYQYASQYDARLVTDGDSFMIGKVKFDVLHTPGHTPESVSLLLTDRGGGAEEPMGVFTGDFIFVGAIGRPDLLEAAAGEVGSAEVGARQLYQSVKKFRQLPDYLQVWPAHGAGSACGKGLGAIPSSTVGYEELFNPALQYAKEAEFVEYILDEQPEAPKYFAVMKRINKEGPRVLGDAGLPTFLGPDQLARTPANATLLDVSSSAEFAAGHAPGSINIPTSMLAGWAGWLVDYDEPLFLIAEPEQLPEAMRVLREIGLEHVEHAFEATALRKAGLMTQSYDVLKPSELATRIRKGELTLLDVRSGSEWTSGHIPCAEHHFLGHLPEEVAALDRSKTFVTQCQTSARSAIAASVLSAAGVDVVDMSGGIAEWKSAGLPVNTPQESIPCDG